MKHRLVNNYCF